MTLPALGAPAPIVSAVTPASPIKNVIRDALNAIRPGTEAGTRENRPVCADVVVAPISGLVRFIVMVLVVLWKSDGSSRRASVNARSSCAVQVYVAARRSTSEGRHQAGVTSVITIARICPP